MEDREREEEDQVEEEQRRLRSDSSPRSVPGENSGDPQADASEGNQSSSPSYNQEYGNQSSSSSYSYDYNNRPYFDPAYRTDDLLASSGSETSPPLRFDVPSPLSEHGERRREQLLALLQPDRDANPQPDLPDFHAPFGNPDPVRMRRRMSDMELEYDRRIKRAAFEENNLLGQRGHSNIVEWSYSKSQEQLADKRVLLRKIAGSERKLLLDREKASNGKFVTFVDNSLRKYLTFV